METNDLNCLFIVYIGFFLGLSFIVVALNYGFKIAVRYIISACFVYAFVLHYLFGASPSDSFRALWHSTGTFAYCSIDKIEEDSTNDAKFAIAFLSILKPPIKFIFNLGDNPCEENLCAEFQIANNGNDPSPIPDPELKLLKKFAPVFHFSYTDADNSKQWLPTEVKAMPYQSMLITRNGNLEEIIEENPGVNDLTSATGGGNRFLKAKDPQNLTGKNYERTVYCRKTADKFGRTILQYWIFYVYNSKFLLLDHEGDWEYVAIKLNTDNSDIEEVACAQHFWFEIKKKDDPELELLQSEPAGKFHPVIYVADGSHASYFTPGQKGIQVNVIDVAGGAVIAFFAGEAIVAKIIEAGIGKEIATRIVTWGALFGGKVALDHIGNLANQQDIQALTNLYNQFNVFTIAFDDAKDEELLKSYQKIKLNDQAWLDWSGHWGCRPLGSITDGPLGPKFHDEWNEPFSFWNIPVLNKAFHVPSSMITN